jgi:hypothetical protein
MRYLLCLSLVLIFIASANSQELQLSNDCLKCHQTIVEEWKTSRHAASTEETNPFYSAMLKWANESSDGQAQEKCNKCHVPVKFLGATEETTNRLAYEGVTCDVCHATQQSGKWLQIGAENTKYGPYKDAVSVVHSSEFSSFLISNDQCLTCHANLENAHGFSFCSTEEEFKQSSFYKSGVTCQDCHMPAVKSKATELGKIRNIHSHKFYGGYNSQMLHNCAELSLAAEGDSTFLTVQVTVQNKGVGHALPTGSPMRSVYLKMAAFDAEGVVVWKNFINNPIKDDPKAVFMRLLQNDAGAAPVPPWEASGVRFDQRLMPDESRTLEYMLSDTPAKKIVAELYYRLAPPALVKKLNLDSETYGEPILIASQSVIIK